MDYLTTRMISSFLSGIILSQTGSLIQIGTRNILASPSTLGVEGLSVLWILSLHSLLILLGIQVETLILVGVPFFVLMGFFFSRIAGKEYKVERVLFAGLTFNLLVGAVFSLWQFFFMAFNLPFPMDVWFGNFRFTDVRAVGYLLLFELTFMAVMAKLWSDFELYTLGPSVSRSHQLSLRKLFSAIYILAFVGTYVVIAFFGAFSFLGLLFPIVARKWWFRRFDLKGEIFLGAVMNGLIFMIVDFFCYRFPVMGAEIPVGLIASVMGAVCLIVMVLKGRSGPEFLANTRK